ncbi:hypothetical protein [uncultured Piscinibacter sp.]|uniref:hypothetical protein n=1 Tax=uncultured Piscinibacter sp. TaxID=1131835 RepID=UPI00262A0588|nr:hypothetical protein [uncultured Piscinibacter sp.]
MNADAAQRAWSNWAAEAKDSAEFVGFGRLGLTEIVTFTLLTHGRFGAIMERIGMRNTRPDFERPVVPKGSALRPHGLCAITRNEWRGCGGEPSPKRTRTDD